MFGIITHYDVHNHGAVLQLFGLIKTLKREFGIDAKALQFEKNYDFLGHTLKAKYDISLKSFRIYLNYLKENGFAQFLYNFQKKRLLDGFKTSHNLIGPYYTECGELEGVIVGSDEVFALHTGPTPVFFGHACPADKVFAYGGSFGPTTIQDIERLHCQNFVASGLSAMKGLGMRDKNSREITFALTGRSAEEVCDPVLLYGFKDELENMERPVDYRYMLVYAYDKRMNENDEVSKIRAYAKSRGLRIVSPGFFHKWVDCNVNVDPIELLRYFKFADCVVTDTFHGSVISIITHKEFAVRLRDNSNKLLNLLEEYGLENRVLSGDVTLAAIFNRRIDYGQVVAEIGRRRNASLDYLRRMIEE